MNVRSTDGELDVVIVGAGFAGLYALYRCRALGLRARVFERGPSVGGTWYWNRYPGARCDIESLYYSYSFSKELEQTWTWSSRYAPQPEILAYLNHVADRFDLRKDVQLDTTITAARFNETTARWDISTDRGAVGARFYIMATGCLSAGQLPQVEGLERFKGAWHHTGDWPKGGVDFRGKRVGVIGTGSSGIQMTPIVAQDAQHLHIFQRTPQYAVPARNQDMGEERMREAQAHYDQIRADMRKSFVGIPYSSRPVGAVEDAPEVRQECFDKAWENGGYIVLTCYPDVLLNEKSNALLGEFAWDQISQRIKDPKVAEKLKPDYPFGAKRLCAETDYFEMFNRDNVTLVDLRESGIRDIVETGVRLDNGEVIELDILIFATGFDAMTGAILSVDIRGRNGLPIQQKWRNGPANYLGVSVAGFPNLFTVTGPGSPSVLYNMVAGIEQHVDWITDCIRYVVDQGYGTIEALPEEEKKWTAHVDEVAAQTLYPRAKSWYMGRNTPGKVEGFMPYAGGGLVYRQIADEVASNGYRGFVLARVKAGRPQTA